MSPRPLFVFAALALCSITPSAQQLTPHPSAPASCSTDISVPPNQTIAACSTEIRDLKLQRTAEKKHANKCTDEQVWADSTRHPNNPGWYVPSASHGGGIPTAGDPHTADCNGFSAADSHGTVQTLNAQLAGDLRTRADAWLSLKKYAAAYNDYDESYSTVRNEDVFKARRSAAKLLKQARKAYRQPQKTPVQSAKP